MTAGHKDRIEVSLRAVRRRPRPDRGAREGPEERWLGLERRLSAIETALDRLEKRIWIAVYGVATVILSHIAYGLR
jgi:hypothetical protein